MTENKRLRYNLKEGSIDGLLSAYEDNRKPLTHLQVLDRLNEQEEEIYQLKQDLNKKMKCVAIQESESTIRVDFDEFVQLCEDSNDLKEKEERIKELEKENKSLQIEVLGQSEEIEILSDENKRLKQQCLNFMEMLDDMSIAYLLNDDLEYILGLVE